LPIEVFDQSNDCMMKALRMAIMGIPAQASEIQNWVEAEGPDWRFEEVVQC